MWVEKFKALAKKFPHSVRHLLHYIAKRKFRKYHNPFRVPSWYSKYLAPNLSFYLYWALYPVFLYLKKNNTKFLINNITNSPGHVMMELDYFARIQSKTYKYILVCPRSEVAHGSKLAYENLFHRFIVSDFFYMLIEPFLMRYCDLTIDSSLSSEKRELQSCKNIGFHYFPIFILEKRNYHEVWDRVAHYHEVRTQTNNYLPLKIIPEIDERLRSFIGNNNEKIALIQIKDIVGNGTALATDPISYLDSINWLLKFDYKLIFVGREKMPNLFRGYSIINYSEWSHNNFYYDMQLVSIAKIVISSASGFGNIASNMGIPLVYTNEWNFVCPAPGKYTVTIPCVFRDKNSNPWPFSFQTKYFYDRGDSNSPIKDEFFPRNATGTEILAAVKESFELYDKLIVENELQIKFRKLLAHTPYGYSDCRISNNFIEKFKDLM